MGRLHHRTKDGLVLLGAAAFSVPAALANTRISSPASWSTIEVWGRPVGVAVAHDGALLVSEDDNGTVWRVTH